MPPEISAVMEALYNEEVRHTDRVIGAAYDDPLNDRDDDGIGNGCDNCVSTANPFQQDADSDGLGDACDSCPVDPGEDDDGDGLCGAADADADDDEVDNAMDNCPGTANTDQADTDGDGAGDSCDNCNVDSNASQADSDGDGIGDVCDPCPLDGTNDPDRDGVCNDLDNCVNVVNPIQGDADTDGVGDACDNCPDDDNRHQTDADADGRGAACDFDDLNAECIDAVDAVSGLAWDANLALGWQPVVGAIAYNVHQGGAGFDAVMCAVVATEETLVEGLPQPGAGELLTYVVAALGHCGEGALGAASNGSPRVSTACEPDPDNDGIALGQDNCPGVHNPGQTDTDNDGVGDACDGGD